MARGREDGDVEEHGAWRDKEPGDAEVAEGIWSIVLVKVRPFGMFPSDELPGVEDDGYLQVEVETDHATDNVHRYLTAKVSRITRGLSSDGNCA